MKFTKNIIVIISILLSSTINAQSLNYSESAAPSLGNTFDIAFPGDRTANCLQYNPKDNDWLDGGANVQFDMQVVNNYEKLSKLLDFKTVYNSKVNGSLEGVFSGEASTKFTGSFVEFRENESEHMLIVIRAVADYGRFGIKNESIKADKLNIINESSKEEFIEKCGTHFFYAERRKQTIAIVIEISNLNKSKKEWLSAHYGSNIGAKIGIDNLNVGVNSTMSATFKSFINLSKKYGKVNIKFTANGVKDLASVSPALESLSAENLVGIVNSLKESMKGLTKESSKPVEYLFAPLLVHGGPKSNFPEERVETISELYMYLGTITSQRNKVKKIIDNLPQNSNIDYKSYYDGMFVKSESLVSSIKSMIRNCINDISDTSICTSNSEELEIYWPFDLLVEYRAQASCIYYINPEAPINTEAKKGAPLQSVTISFDGLARGPYEKYDLSWKGFYLDNFFVEQSTHKSLQGLTARFGDIIYDSSIQKEYGAVTQEFLYQLDYIPLIERGEPEELNSTNLMNKYKNAKNRVYGVIVPYDREDYQYVIGKASYSNCPLYKQ